MTILPFLLLIIGAILAYFINRRAAASLRLCGATLNSSPEYHGLYAGLAVVIPAIAITLLWMFLDGNVIERMVLAGLPSQAFKGEGAGGVSLVLSDIQALAGGRVFGEPEPWKKEAANQFNALGSAWDILLIATIGIV